jgi:hypothetical protein
VYDGKRAVGIEIANLEIGHAASLSVGGLHVI